MSQHCYGLRVVGCTASERRLVDWRAAFEGHASCDCKARLDQESYLSTFVFPPEFEYHFRSTGSEAAYDGPCWASWVWWDLDREGFLESALGDARRLCATILARYPEFDEADLLIFLSGKKGVHIGFPSVWQPQPSASFNAVARQFALDLAGAAGVKIDAMIYSKVRLFRAPNSRHPATGLHKRRLSYGELMHLKLEAIVEMARAPEPFEIPSGPARCPRAADDWWRAEQAVGHRTRERAALREGPAKLSAFARRFIRDGELDQKQREVSTFKVAAALTELYLTHGFESLLFALLEEPALDSGLPPSEVRHAIEGGWKHARRQQEGGCHE